MLGGVIGGKNQYGRYKLDSRFNKTDLIQRIKKIALFRHSISLHRQDAASLIDTVLPTIPKRSLVYLDPPYYLKGKGLYEHHYEHDDHAGIAKKVRKIKQSWIVSYDIGRTSGRERVCK